MIKEYSAKAFNTIDEPEIKRSFCQYQKVLNGEYKCFCGMIPSEGGKDCPYGTEDIKLKKIKDEEDEYTLSIDGCEDFILDLFLVKKMKIEKGDGGLDLIITNEDQNHLKMYRLRTYKLQIKP